MKTKLFIDTNIILDMAMSERPQHVAALQLLDEIELNKAEGYICGTTLKDVYYILSKYFGEQNARAYIAALIEVFNISTIDYSICKIAVNSNEPDFEDGLVRVCAETAKVTYIISRDETAFMMSPIKRLSAQEYIDTYSNWEEVGL